MSTMCKGICHRYKAKASATKKRYDSGQKFCSICKIFSCIMTNSLRQMIREVLLSERRMQPIAAEHLVKRMGDEMEKLFRQPDIWQHLGPTYQFSLICFLHASQTGEDRFFHSRISDPLSSPCERIPCCFLQAQSRLRDLGYQ